MIGLEVFFAPGTHRDQAAREMCKLARRLNVYVRADFDPVDGWLVWPSDSVQDAIRSHNEAAKKIEKGR